MQHEKYPSGWEHQFATGIKTIAVIAVPQGVVQLGSTRVILEDLKLIGHVKALFGTLQNVPGAFLSDFVSEVQKGGAHMVYPLAVSAPHLMNVQSPTLARTPSLPANMSLAMAGAAAYNSNLGCSGVGRMPMMLASQQILTSWPSPPPVRGFQENVSHFPHSFLDKPGLESMSELSFPFFKPSRTSAGPIDNMGTCQPGVTKLSCITAPTLSTGGVKSNSPPPKGITRHLSLSSKASSIALPVLKVPSSQAGHSSFSVDCSLTGGEGVSVPMLELSEYSRAHSQSGPVSRTKSLGPVDGNTVITELSDIASSVGSCKTVIRTTEENLSGATGTPGLGNTQSLHCNGLVKSRQLVGARPAAEQPCSRLSEQSLSVQAESDRHLAKRQQLGSSRSSTESQQLNAPSVEAGQLDWGSHVTEKVPGVVGNRLAGESGQLISPSPIAESSLLVVDRPSIQSGQYLDKQKRLFVRSGQFGGANIATEKIHSVSERSSVESSQPRDNIASISMASGGVSMHLERSSSSTVKQESCMTDFLSMSAETSTLQCEQSLQTFDTDNSHLTGQMSDLLQLAKHFENADKEDYEDLSCDKADLHQSISSSLLCDDLFENLQSSKSLFQNVELNAWDSGSVDNSIENLFTNELDEFKDFDDFFAWLAKAEKSKSETSPRPVLFARKPDTDVSASLSSQDYGGITKGKEHLGKYMNGSNASPYQFDTPQARCEPTLHTLDADQPFSNCFDKAATLPCKELPSIQREPQFDRFVNSRIHPKVSFPCFRSTDGDTELGCHERAALPPASMPVKNGKKRSRPEEIDSARQSKDMQQMQERIQELRTIVPDGARCSIDTLLGKAAEYTNFLQSMSQDFGKRTQSSNLQSHVGGLDVGIGSEATSINASWAMDLGTQGSFCPIVVENLRQPGQMLVEMLCEEHGIFLEVADTIRTLGLTILKGVMEARNNHVWARFVTEGPQDVHRVRVLWSLMKLLGSKMP